jgi:hypothetical protein
MAEQGLKPDFLFYITNQIAKPVAQVFGLVVDRLPGVKSHQLKGLDSAGREKLAEELLFGAALRVARRDAAGLVDIRGFFGKTSTPK